MDQEPRKVAPIEQMASMAKAFTMIVWTPRNWHEFLTREAPNARSVPHKEALILLGYSVPLTPNINGDPAYSQDPRHAWYLAIADGWRDSRLLIADGVVPQREPKRPYCLPRRTDAWELVTESRLRQHCARYAFVEVGKHLFADAVVWMKDPAFARGLHSNDWCKQVCTFALSPTFLTLQQFFRIEDGGAIRNLAPASQDTDFMPQRQAIEFCKVLVSVLWTWTDSVPSEELDATQRVRHAERMVSTRSALEDAQPWLIEVLSYLGELSILERLVLNPRSHFFLDLSVRCQQKLDEIARRTMLRVEGTPERLVLNLREACMMGSPAALFLLRYKVAMSEFNQLKSADDRSV